MLTTTNKDYHIAFDPVTESINDLNIEYQKLEETYEKVKKCFDRIRDAHLEGDSATEMLNICDIWEELNNNRLNQINNYKEALSNAYNLYTEAHQNVTNMVK